MSGMNKGTLNRLLGGSRSAKFNDILTISNVLGLTSGEREMIFNTFFGEMYGERDMSAVRFAVKEYPRADYSAADSVPDRGYDKYPESGFMPDMQKVEDAIFSITDLEDGTIYTNFEFKNRRLDDFFFQKASSGRLELVHFVEKIQNGGELENLYTLIRSIRYMNLKQFPYITNIWQTARETQLLPFFVLTKKAAVLFNDSCGFITDRPGAIAHLTATVQKMASSATRLGSTPADIMEVKNLAAGSAIRNDEMITMCKYPCFAAHITREMMYEAANDVPHKDQLIEICASHYEALLKNAPKTQVTTLEGLEDFAVTGNFYEIPAEFVHGFSPQTRVALLEAIKAEIANGTFFILNKPNALPEGVILECYSDKTVIAGADTTQKDFGLAMQFRYSAQDPFYFRLMRIMKEYLIASQHVYPAEAALRIIDNCITLAKNS